MEDVTLNPVEFVVLGRAHVVLVFCDHIDLRPESGFHRFSNRRGKQRLKKCAVVVVAGGLFARAKMQLCGRSSLSGSEELRVVGGILDTSHRLK